MDQIAKRYAQSGKRGTFITAKKLLIFANIRGVFQPNFREKGIILFNARDQACLSTQTGSPMPGTLLHCN